MNNTVLESLIDMESSIWVFGYGSLTWKPNFIYKSKEIGYIHGYQRRFWQGNVTHRGTVNKPGRVATLIKSEMDDVWGVAYKITGRNHILKALSYLNKRESKLGGYNTVVENFFARNQEIRKVLVYTATTENEHYLGPCNMATMATEIMSAKGEAGSNTEYVTRLAEYVRKHIPEEKDLHLFTLEKYILYLTQRRNVNHHVNDTVIPLTYDRLIGEIRT